MAQIVSDKFVFDLNVDDAVNNIVSLARAITDYEEKAATGQKATNNLVKSDKDLIRSRKLLQDALGQEVKTLDGLTAKQKLLTQIQGKLEIGSKEYVAVQKQISNLNQKITTETNKQIGAQTGLIGRLKETVSNYKTLIAGAAGIGTVGVLFAQAAKQVEQLDKKINSVKISIKGLSDQQSLNLTGDIEASSQTFGLDFNNQLNAIKTATNEFQAEATDVFAEIQKGLIRSTTDEARSELLEQVREYSTFFRQAGLDLSQSIGVINLGDSLGIFNDKAADAVKETVIRLSEQTKPVIEGVINAFGESFANQLFTDLDNGLPAFEALQRISTEIGNTNINAQQYQELVAAIGGGALEDAGRNFLASIKDIGNEADATGDKLTDYQKDQLQLLETNRELARTQVQIADEFRSGLREYDNTLAKVKLLIAQGLLQLVKVFKELPGFVKENKVELLGLASSIVLLKFGAIAGQVQTLSAAFKTLRASIRATIVEQRLFNVLAKTNPYVLLASGVIALVSALSILNKRNKENIDINRKVQEGVKAATNTYIDERKELDRLFGQLGKTNQKRAEKKKVIEEIQSRYGKYLDNIDLEKAGQVELEKAYKKVNAAIIENIIARQQAAEAENIVKQIIDLQTDINLDDTAVGDLFGQSAGVFDFLRNSADALKGNLDSAVDGARLRQIAQLKNDLGALPERFKLIGDALKTQFQNFDLSFLSQGDDSPTGNMKAFADATASTSDKAEVLKNSLAALESELNELEKKLKEQTDVSDLPALRSILKQITEQRKLIEAAKLQIAKAQTGKRDFGTIPTIPSGAISSVNSTTASDAEANVDVNIKVNDDDLDDVSNKFDEIFNNSVRLKDEIFNLFGTIANAQKERLDELVSKQEDTIANILANSEDFNERQLTLEKDRLEKLKDEQRKAAEDAQTFAQIQAVANSVVAVSQQATLPFPANIIAIAATLAALAAGFIQAKSLGSNAFYEGTDYVSRGQHKPGRDTIPAMLNEGEGVLQTDQNRKYSRTFKAMRRGSIPPELLNGFTQAYQDGSLSDFVANMKILKPKFQSVGNFDLTAMLKEKGVNIYTTNIVKMESVETGISQLNRGVEIMTNTIKKSNQNTQKKKAKTPEYIKRKLRKKLPQ